MLHVLNAMHGVRLATLVLATTGALTAGCSSEDPTGRKGDPPELGGTLPTASPPIAPMDDLERPVAELLQTQVASQGLTVDALDCPTWDGSVPAELSCQGWFDTVPGRVAVSLTAGEDKAVEFDAVLQDGVIATKKLVDGLLEDGYERADCGKAPAYPTDVGSTITCAVTRDGIRSYVRATITDVEGGVTISAL